LYQVDNKSFLLDFMSLAPLDFEEASSRSISPTSSQSSIAEVGTCHYVMEFFEMCSDLIVALAC